MILAEMTIASSWINRTSDTISFTDLQKEFAVALSQLILSRDRVETLIRGLGNWLESPTPFSVDLCPDAEDQNLTFYLGPRSASKHLANTVFEVRYSGIYFDAAKWSFAVDQSCVRIFADELVRSLADLGHSA